MELVEPHQSRPFLLECCLQLLICTAGSAQIPAVAQLRIGSAYCCQSCCCRILMSSQKQNLPVLSSDQFLLLCAISNGPGFLMVPKFDRGKSLLTCRNLEPCEASVPCERSIFSPMHYR